MYMQRAPHPLVRYRSRDPSSLNILQSTASETQPASIPHPSGYVVLAVVLAILLCSMIGFLIARRLLPLSLKRRVKNNSPKGSDSSVTPKEHRSEFDMLPSLGGANSPAPSSLSSEGPPTPSADYENERESDLRVPVKDHQADPNAPVQIPIYVYTPTQMHQPKLISSSEIPTTSAIRPHGLPLWPVPEESSTIPTLPSSYDDDELFYLPSST